MTIAALLSWADQALIKFDEGNSESRVLLCALLRMSHASLISRSHETLSLAEINDYKTLVKSRMAGTPVSYLTHSREFWSLDLYVDENVLIPRHETERLVERCLELIDAKKQPEILELGSGSGAISLALAKERKDATILATDINTKALQIAKKNQKKHGINNINWLESDWFDQVAENHFDLICANPPYVANHDQHLSMGDLRFEPKSALIAEENGYKDIYYIIDNANRYLKEGGGLCLEHGYQQGNAVAKRLADMGYSKVITHQDLAGNDRVTEGCWLMVNG